MVCLVTSSVSAAEEGLTVSHTYSSTSATLPGSLSHKNFKALAKKAGIATRSESGFRDIASGYYVVAGVFGNTENASRLRRKLNSKGLVADMLFHPEKKLNYVVLSHHDQGSSAVSMVQSAAEGKYHDKTWILHVFDANAEKSVNSEVFVPATSETAGFQPVSFKQEAKLLGIASRKMQAQGQWGKGFYVIAGVFGDIENAERFMYKMRDMGYRSRTRINPESGHAYTYLEHFDSADSALEFLKGYTSDNKNEKVWVLEVEGAEQLARRSSTPDKTVKPASKMEE